MVAFVFKKFVVWGFSIAGQIGSSHSMILRHRSIKDFAKVHSYKALSIKMKSLNFSRLCPTAFSMNVLRLMPGK